MFVLPHPRLPLDLCSVLRTQSPYFREVRVSGNGTLLDTLVETFSLPPGVPVSVRRLWEHQPADGSGLAGSLVWVSGACPQEFHALSVELSALNASAQPYEHAILLTAAERWEQPGHAAVRTLTWDDAVGSLDVQLLAAHLLRDHVPPSRLSFMSLLVAQLALYDLDLVPELARLPLDDLLQPEAFLCGVAQRRGWSVDLPASFEVGSLGMIDGAVRLHSARKALDGSLRRRVWRAQVAALWPALEVRRQRFVQEYRDLITPHLPLVRGQGPRPLRVESLDDVEFTDLADLATKYQSLWPGDMSSTFRDFAYLRNDLAHLQPLRRDAVERLLG
ncbi:hypothetical protein V3W47_16575 [Deinococcus sp. YIM 134068]|uniref:hypothetical protein n=1 Tax=Deinococcus lichenicola TaxID=3118910 RepID=UPI002F9340AA